MNALLQIAGEFLTEAKAALDGRSRLTEAELNDHLDLARELIDQGTREMRHEAIVAAAREAEHTIDYLEQVRRLVSYGLNCKGQAGREEIQFLELMASRPPLDKTKGISGCIPAFEWLKAHRPTLDSALAKIIPPPEPQPETTNSNTTIE